MAGRLRPGRRGVRGADGPVGTARLGSTPVHRIDGAGDDRCLRLAGRRDPPRHRRRAGRGRALRLASALGVGGHQSRRLGEAEAIVDAGACCWRPTLRTALAAFEAMGTPVWADRARTELSRSETGRRRSVGLTPSEQHRRTRRFGGDQSGHGIHPVRQPKDGGGEPDSDLSQAQHSLPRRTGPNHGSSRLTGKHPIQRFLVEWYRPDVEGESFDSSVARLVECAASTSVAELRCRCSSRSRCPSD